MVFYFASFHHLSKEILTQLIYCKNCNESRLLIILPQPYFTQGRIFKTLPAMNLSQWADVDGLWQTEMEIQTPLNVQILVSMDAKISQISSRNKFWMVVLFSTKLYSKKLGRVLKTLPWVTKSFQSMGRIGLIVSVTLQ